MTANQRRAAGTSSPASSSSWRSRACRTRCRRGAATCSAWSAWRSPCWSTLAITARSVRPDRSARWSSAASIGAVVARRVRDDADAGAGRRHALAGRPGGGADRHRGGQQPDGVRPAVDPIPAGNRSSCSSARSSARSRSRARSSRSASSPGWASTSACSRARRWCSRGSTGVNLLLGIAMVGFGLAFFIAGAGAQWPPFIVMTAIAFVLGVLIIIPIGGADMPVVISMLNSYSGWAAAGIGFSLNNPMLIVAGSLVGSLRRDPVLHHVQGDEPLVLQRDPGRLRRGRGRRGAGARAEERSSRASPTTSRSCWATPRA